MDRSCGIAVKGVNDSITEADLQGAFAGFGGIAEVFLKAERGYAFVTFSDAASVAKAVAGAPAEVAGVNIRVEARTAAKPREQAPVSVNVYLNGLAESTTAEQVQASMAAFGAVDLDAITMNADKGFAFVTFNTEAEASACVGAAPHKINNSESNAEFRRSAPRGPRGGRRDGGEGGERKPRERKRRARKPREIAPNSVYLKGIDTECTEDDISAALGKFGSIASVEKRPGRDYAFAAFTDAAGAAAAVAGTGLDMGGNSITIEERTGPKDAAGESKE